MVKSKSTIPHAAGIDEADISQLVALKSRAKERAAQKKIHLTFLPFVMKALVAALQEHPCLNASLDAEKSEIILKKYYNIGVAVDTKDGLMVPVVKNVRAKNIFQLAAELEALSEKARSRTIDEKTLSRLAVLSAMPSIRPMIDFWTPRTQDRNKGTRG